MDLLIILLISGFGVLVAFGALLTFYQALLLLIHGVEQVTIEVTSVGERVRSKDSEPASTGNVLDSLSSHTIYFRYTADGRAYEKKHVFTWRNFLVKSKERFKQEYQAGTRHPGWYLCASPSTAYLQKPAAIVQITLSGLGFYLVAICFRAVRDIL